MKSSLPLLMVQKCKVPPRSGQWIRVRGGIGRIVPKLFVATAGKLIIGGKGCYSI
jgi:hypothetical protein